nr:hypothetical protein [uncultured Actinoplanes sp.]
MPDKPHQHIGRAPVRRPPRGRARVGRAVGKAQTPENAVTNVIRTSTQEKAPVFVDPSGRRRRRVRRVAYGIGVGLLLILVVVWISQLGGSARPPVPTPSVTVTSVRQ